MDNNCVLKLNHLVFDEIAFNRVNFKSESDLRFEVGFHFEQREGGEFIAGIRVAGEKEGEYEFVVRASGYFQLEEDVESSEIISRQNAIAIIFPYVRSQITLLTAQPEVDPVVFPPMNIAQMVEDAMRGEV